MYEMLATNLKSVKALGWPIKLTHTHTCVRVPSALTDDLQEMRAGGTHFS